MHTSRWILAALLALAPAATRANVRLPALFTDNMVLQRDVAGPIWGCADDGEQITIEINGKKVTTVAKDGKFKTKLPNFQFLKLFGYIKHAKRKSYDPNGIHPLFIFDRQLLSPH